jgi:hypothetical protein
MNDSETVTVVEYSLPAAYSQGGFVQVRTVLVPAPGTPPPVAVDLPGEAGNRPASDGSPSA